MRKIKQFILVFFSLFLFTSCKAKNDLQQEVIKDKVFRGVWITNVASEVMNSESNIEKAVLHCKSLGITDIFLVVWNGGYTLYPSTVMQEYLGVPISSKFEGRDPLREMIVIAHKNNIKVHAWFEYGFASSNNQNGGHILNKFKHWSSKDINGNITKKNNFEWMNPFHPEVQTFIKSLILEVVKNYDVDGVQGDDRLPALPSIGGYDEYTVSLYKSQHKGNEPPVNHLDQGWLNWRSAQLTLFLKDLYKSVKDVKPSVLVTSAPSVHPWSKNEYLQDWPTWLNEGIIDYVFPQVYRYDIEAYRNTLREQVSYLNSSTKSKFYPGILIRNADYTPSQSFFNQMIETNRQFGIKGEVFWFYEGLTSPSLKINK